MDTSMDNTYESKMKALKAEGQAERASQVSPAAASGAKQVSEHNGSGGYVYGLMDDGSYKILRSPKSKGGQVVKADSEFHDLIANDIEHMKAMMNKPMTKPSMASALGETPLSTISDKLYTQTQESPMYQAAAKERAGMMGKK